MFAIIAVVTFKLHGTATQVAMVLVSFMAPLAIVSPLVRRVRGPVALEVDDDRKRPDPRRAGCWRWCSCTTCTCIYVILFTMSVVSAFLVPAQSVAVRTLVPMAGLMAANGLMSQAQQGSLIVAPSVAGELVQLARRELLFRLRQLQFSSFRRRW